MCLRRASALTHRINRIAQGSTQSRSRDEWLSSTWGLDDARSMGTMRTSASARVDTMPPNDKCLGATCRARRGNPRTAAGAHTQNLKAAWRRARAAPRGLQRGAQLRQVEALRIGMRHREPTPRDHHDGGRRAGSASAWAVVGRGVARGEAPLATPPPLSSRGGLSRP